MNFSEYSRRLRQHLSGIHNQSHFVGLLFNAAGSNYFPDKGTSGEDDNQKKLFNGSRAFNKNMKASFPSPINKQVLAAFFDTHIGDTSLTQIMTAFGMPDETSPNKALLISALCTQFQNIVSEASNYVDDIVVAEYKRLLHDRREESSPAFPLYPGDDIELVESTPAHHSVGFYELFEHTWVIRNAGAVTWESRTLECVDAPITRIRPTGKSVILPKTKPGDAITLQIQMDARGFEGTYESVWKMKDAEERLCFPNKNKIMIITATVVNDRSKTAEG